MLSIGTIVKGRRLCPGPEQGLQRENRAQTPRDGSVPEAQNRGTAVYTEKWQVSLCLWPVRIDPDAPRRPKADIWDEVRGAPLSQGLVQFTTINTNDRALGPLRDLGLRVK